MAAAVAVLPPLLLIPNHVVILGVCLSSVLMFAVVINLIVIISVIAFSKLHSISNLLLTSVAIADACAAAGAAPLLLYNAAMPQPSWSFYNLNTAPATGSAQVALAWLQAVSSFGQLSFTVPMLAVITVHRHQLVVNGSDWSRIRAVTITAICALFSAAFSTSLFSVGQMTVSSGKQQQQQRRQLRSQS